MCPAQFHKDIVNLLCSRLQRKLKEELAKQSQQTESQKQWIVWRMLGSMTVQTLKIWQLTEMVTERNGPEV